MTNNNSPKNPLDMASQLLTGNFARSGADTLTLSDPIVDTPMVVTLDNLRPYELNPRVTRNPLYDDIKASIRERGLDAAPAITRRPDATHYIIRNGGNTRLAILGELWSETRDEKFFRIACLFRPWQSEIIALTGHLAENELHGSLTFIERALAVEKAREIYEQEKSKELSQTELAKLLSADGYPVKQPQVSRMQEAVRYLLPSIPTALYGGLSKKQIERLLSLRQSAWRFWGERIQTSLIEADFLDLYQDVLSLLDAQPAQFDFNRIQDELIGRMAEVLRCSYDLVALELDANASRQKALNSQPSPDDAGEPEISPLVINAFSGHLTETEIFKTAMPKAVGSFTSPKTAPTPQTVEPMTAPQSDMQSAQDWQQSNQDNSTPRSDATNQHLLQAHVVSPIETTSRLEAIQHLVAEHTGEQITEFANNVVRAIPVQAGGLYPISDVWYIDSGLDTPERLRTHIAQLAFEIAQEHGLAPYMESTDTDVGYCCQTPVDADANALALMGLLSALSQESLSEMVTGFELADHLGGLLLGATSDTQVMRLSDAATVKLFRLIRLARRFYELAAASGQTFAPGDDNESTLI